MRHRHAVSFPALAAAGVSVVLSLFVSGRAEAGGFETARFGADYGQPAMPNAYAIYFNPGALAGTSGTELTIDGTLALRTIDYNRASSSLTPSANALNDGSYASANSGPAHLSNVVAAPFIGLTTDFGTRDFHLGVASYLPFGGQASWDQNPQYANSRLASAIDGTQRWSDIQGSIISLYNTVAFAYRFERARIGIGAGFNVIYNQVQDLRARNLDGSDDILATDGSLTEGRALLKVSGLDVSASAGVFWEPLESRRMRVGLSYQAQPGFGQMRLSGTLNQQLGSIVQPVASSNVDFLQTYPDIVRLGATWRISDLVELRLDGNYERWSVFKDQCVVEPGASCSIYSNGGDATPKKQIIQVLPRNWKDTVTARGGAGFFLGRTEIFGSGGFASGAPPKSTLDPALFDGNNVFYTVGVKYPLFPHVRASLSYNYIYYLPINTTGESTLANFVPPSRTPNAGGTYDSQIFFFNANVTYTF